MWSDLNLRAFAPWQIVAVLGLIAAAWGVAVLAWMSIRRRRMERALVLWEDVCRRLARAGMPRQPHEGPLAFAQRAALRWPQFSIALAAIGEAYATLRYGSLAAGSRERAALIATRIKLDFTGTPPRIGTGRLTIERDQASPCRNRNLVFASEIVILAIGE